VEALSEGDTKAILPEALNGSLSDDDE